MNVKNYISLKKLAIYDRLSRMNHIPDVIPLTKTLAQITVPKDWSIKRIERYANDNIIYKPKPGYCWKIDFSKPKWYYNNNKTYNLKVVRTEFKSV